jgi:hypothetical protein
MSLVGIRPIRREEVIYSASAQRGAKENCYILNVINVIETSNVYRGWKP